MSQDDMTRVINSAREGQTLVVNYESPQGERRFGIKIVSVKRDAKGRIQRVGLERGTAVWMYVQQKKVDADTMWYIFQPNPYPIHGVAVERAKVNQH